MTVNSLFPMTSERKRKRRNEKRLHDFAALFGKIAVTLSVGRYCRMRNDAKTEMKNGLTATA